MVDERRVRYLNDRPASGGPVVYWMQRDQRLVDNWALLYAKDQADTYQSPLYVLFNLVPQFGAATWRQYDFMLQGLREVAESCKAKNIGFIITVGDPAITIPAFVRQYHITEVVTDFSPLRIARRWKQQVAKSLEVRLSEVDAHNVVPCWVASDKEEFAAYTFRPKVHQQLPEFLVPFPKLTVHRYGPVKVAEIKWLTLNDVPSVDRTVSPIAWCVPGETAAQKTLKSFLRRTLSGYASYRNDPVVNHLSQLSPYLHFGQIGAQTVALAIKRQRNSHCEDKKAFLEELLVRKELSDNYCYYQPAYDSLKGVRSWARETLENHQTDKRHYIYTKKQFENAATHDHLWNAMQIQMMKDGKMHGWCRMYWAKKILEWTKKPAQAVKIAIYLNDKYELDGRDPNGYVGILWAIAGLHDRGWSERPIFGKIRYMNYRGAIRKFDVAAYIKKYSEK